MSIGQVGLHGTRIDISSPHLQVGKAKCVSRAFSENASKVRKGIAHLKGPHTPDAILQSGANLEQSTKISTCISIGHPQVKRLTNICHNSNELPYCRIYGLAKQICFTSRECTDPIHRQILILRKTQKVK